MHSQNLVELSPQEIEDVSGALLPLVAYFAWGMASGALATSAGMYWASQE